MTESSLHHIAAEFRADVAALPTALRTLLEHELAAGNRIVTIGHHHPAPPVGAFVMLEQRVTTQPRVSSTGITFVERNSSLYCGEFADLNRHFFILEAPGPPPEEPDMNAIREAANRPGSNTVPESPSGSEAMQRFQRSRNINYSQWHDGTGYDLTALRDMTASEQDAVLSSMIPPAGWRDVEVLVAVGTARAEDALRHAAMHGSSEVTLAIADRAPSLVRDAGRTDMMLRAIKSADIMSGLSEALDQMEAFHPPVVIDALFTGILEREGDVAYHFAETLALIYGKIESRFDWSLRPLLLRFNTASVEERHAALRELKAVLGV